MPSLPSALGAYRQYRRSFPPAGTRIVARVRHQARQQATADLEFLDATGAVVARLAGYECVLDPSLRASFRQNRLRPDVLFSR